MRERIFELRKAKTQLILDVLTSILTQRKRKSASQNRSLDYSPSAMDRGAVKVQIYGFLSLPDDLREYCAAMLEVFDDVHKSTPNVTFEIVS